MEKKTTKEKKGKKKAKTLTDMSKIELIEAALLKNVGGAYDTCGEDAGTNCYHDTCYTFGSSCSSTTSCQASCEEL